MIHVPARPYKVTSSAISFTPNLLRDFVGLGFFLLKESIFFKIAQQQISCESNKIVSGTENLVLGKLEEGKVILLSK